MKILAWIIGLPIAIIVVWGIGRLLFCGPDKSIQKITDPMATAILEYINIHGRPESLMDIPNLPYTVEGCKQLEKYVQKNYKTTESEQCQFTHKKEKFSIKMAHYTAYTSKKYSFGVNIFSSKKNIYIWYYFTQEKSGKKLKLKQSKIRYWVTPFACRHDYFNM